MKKGGYMVVDLADYNITSEGVTIAGIYNHIVENKRKVILLSGVTIKGVKFSDMFVKVVKAGDDFRLTGYSVTVDDTISSYDFFVEDDDTVTLIEEEVEAGSSGMENPMTTAGDIIVGGEDGTPTALPIGTAGQVLKVGANGPEWGADSAGMTNPMTTAGDMIGGSIEGTPYRIPKGTQGQVLTMGASFPEWQTPSSGGAEHLYWHSVILRNDNVEASAGPNYVLFIAIINTTSTAIDKDALKALVNAHATGRYVASAGVTTQTGVFPVYLAWGSSDNIFNVYVNTPGSTSLTTIVQTWSNSNVNVYDAVTQIF